MVSIKRIRDSVFLIFLVFPLLGLQAATNPAARLSALYDSCRQALKVCPPEEDVRIAYRELEIANELDNPWMEIQGYIDLGRALREMGKYDFALQSVHKAFLLLSSCPDDDLTANANRLTGAIYSELDDPERAMGYLQEAADYYRVSQDTFPYLQTQGEIAVAYGRMEKYEECLECLEQVCRYSDETGAINLQLISMLNMANLFYTMNEADRGLNMLERIQWEIPGADSTQDGLSNKRFLMHYLLIKANLLSLAEDYGEAERLYWKGLTLADSLHDLEVRIDVLKGLLSISHERNDCQQIVSYYQQLHKTEDSLNDYLLRKRITSMEFIYDMAQQQTQLDHIQKRMNVQRLLYGILIVFILIVVLYVFCVGSESWMPRSVKKKFLWMNCRTRKTL